MLLKFLKTIAVVISSGVALSACQTTSVEPDARFKFVPTSGGNVEYFEAASPGTTGIIIFHGNTNNGHDIIRGDLINVSENMRTQFKKPVFAIARPGFGNTSGGVFSRDAHIRDRQKYNVDRVIQAIDGIMKGRNLQKVDFVGFSGGGDIASIVALLRPDMVRKVVVYGAEIDPATQKSERIEGRTFHRASDYEIYAAKVLTEVAASTPVEWHLLYGANDTVVPARSGLMFAEELKRKGFKADARIIPDAKHFDFFLELSPVVQKEIIAELSR